MKTSILLDHEPTPHGRVVRLLLRLEADAPPRTDRLPLNLSLVLDRSGSMHGEKLEAARDAAALLVRRLAGNDIVSVVAYDDQVVTVAEPAQGAAQADLPRRIEQIECGGSTNLSGGWLRGREHVSTHRLEQGVNRVILLTDGLANVGIQDPQRLTGLCAEAKKHGVSTTTIGFGGDYDEKLLRGMADAGGGSMYYIESADQAAAIFNDELQGLLDLGAQNVSVQVVPATNVELVAVHHDYPRASAAGGIRLELGDLYAREPKPVLVEFLVTSDVAAETTIAEIIVAGDVLTAAGGVDRMVTTVGVVLEAGAGARVEPEVRREMLLLEAANARRSALEARERGDFEGAADALASLRHRLQHSGLDDADIIEETGDLAMMEATFLAHAVTPADEKYMNQRAYNSMSGRRQKDELIRRNRQKEGEPPTA